jgi:hypothetical protein
MKTSQVAILMLCRAPDGGGYAFSLAALFLSAGTRDAAYKTAWGIYHVVYETKGYWFGTPEAWDDTGNFRAGMYMQPAAVWAMEMTSSPFPLKDRFSDHSLHFARGSPCQFVR